ncbi:MAG: RNA polymerase sigma factor [Steroidobacteraceae bacterium]|nr:RNA polymerase sigma factor [Steroidobacteraceae bacterium]
MNAFYYDTRPDELLAIRCQLGERAAFDELIGRWHDPLWRYLRSLCDSDDQSADMAQDTWLRVLRGIASLRDPRDLRPWLFGIARRVAMDRLRRKYAQPAEADEALADMPAPEPDGDLELALDDLQHRLDSLPMIERETLALFYLRELKLDQIAGLMSVPVGTVKSRLFRARHLMRLQPQIRKDVP